MSISPSLTIHSVTVGLVERNTLFIPIEIRTQKNGKSVEKAMIDSGAGGKFIDQNFARNSRMKIQNLDEPLKALNVDGTENKRGTIRQYVDLEFAINGKPQTQRLLLTGLGKQKIILGFPWLHEQNPQINWKTGEFKWPTYIPNIKRIRQLTEERERKLLDKSKKEQEPTEITEIKAKYQKAFIEEVQDEEEPMNHTQHPLDDNEPSLLISLLDSLEPEEIWINARTNVATELAAEENKKKEGVSPEKLVPEEYHEYLDIFDEGKANRFPEERPWDHKIEMKEGFEPKSFKNYNLTPEEQLEQDKFLKENLEKGYIRPSQSPMASPFFFVKKKDGKLRPCQDYRYLNDWTIKNAYPLPLISEIMDKLKGAKYFTKLDVRWGYNNVRIKKGDEWKAAFKTNKGLFEPTVMFFGMCNSPATFQGMMDAIFVDMIEGCIVIIYMDNILIFARNQEDLERYTKLVLQRLRENDLFLKALKCKFNKT